MLDLGDHPPRPIPGRGLILEAPVAHQRGATGAAARPGEQVLDLPHQDVIGRQADRVPHLPVFQCLVDRRESKARVGDEPGAKDDKSGFRCARNSR